MVIVINLKNIINITTFIKKKIKNKRHVSFSGSRDQLSINAININKQATYIYLNKITIKIIVAGININTSNTLTFIKMNLISPS